MIGSIRPDLVEDSDPDFSVFVGVDSQTDHLPVDGERNNWGEEALKRKDIEIAEAEAFHKDSVMIGCKKLIERFGKGETHDIFNI